MSFYNILFYFISISLVFKYVIQLVRNGWLSHLMQLVHSNFYYRVFERKRPRLKADQNGMSTLIDQKEYMRINGRPWATISVLGVHQYNFINVVKQEKQKNPKKEDITSQNKAKAFLCSSSGGIISIFLKKIVKNLMQFW